MTDLAEQAAKVEAALRAFMHVHEKTETVNVNGSKEVTTVIPCPCALCQQAREALGT